MSVEIVAFDVFGTLVDWRSSISAELGRIGAGAGIEADWPAVASAWRSRYQPALGRVVSGEAPYQALDVLHRDMLDEVIEEYGLQGLGADERAALVRAWYRLDPWPDTVPGLTAMRERHLLTSLSNGGMSLLTRLAKAAAIPFDCIISAELAGTYKPDPRVYALVPRLFEVPPDRVLMVACHPGDLEHAARAGLRTAFVPRPHEWGHGSTAPAPPQSVDVVASDLVALAARI